MKQFILITLVTIFWSCGTSDRNSNENNHSDHTEDVSQDNKNKPKSPKQTAMVNIGDNHIHIEYSAPSVRNRQIFGGLVAYDEVWVAGAHKATNITFQEDVIINEKLIPAGKYGFYTIPGQEKWTIILNEVWDMHLADDYNQQKDILRFATISQQLEEPVETLTYNLEVLEENTARISLSWADRQISFEVNNAQ
ncbi:DUF2911 domain-containing protein [Marivirga atlantica]|jgi:hypothetical protein|uniref:DUF2911 domain-containing protein n=1 Tax=Marivirga atlantica TaxID=1548457 RepID=A0A937AK25_9BACT|nr:DUF2911 domain-containing protein [Marivirga atlantica]MBL0766929.1 DUF2911 domain-containing protein [Marivirga atlantica]